MERSQRVIVLRRMKALVQKGWIQHGMFGDIRGALIDDFTPELENIGKCCLLGAARIALNEVYGQKKARPWPDGERDVADLLGFATDEHLVNWNDAPKRRKSQVVKKIEAALAKEENQ